MNARTPTFSATPRLLAIALLLPPALALAQSPTQPANPPPTEAPPPPPAAPPPPPIETQQMVEVPESEPEPQAAAPEPSDTGQWVYTGQYGWVWMPYAGTDTYVPTTGAPPEMYVYYPAVGWCWVVAPWVWGLGPQPYFGAYGTARFVWYGRGFGRWYGYAPRYATWGPRSYWIGGRWSVPATHYTAPHVIVNRPPPRPVAHEEHGGRARR